MQRITPCLWFDSNVEEAAALYTSIFENSKTTGITHYGEASAKVSGRPEGSVLTVTFQLDGQDFMALNGGPIYTFSPAISLFVNCTTEEEIDRLFQKLSEGGMVLMELSKYPFSEKFAWINDRFGVSWQLNLASRKQKITPFLMFVGEQHGKAEEAVNLYVSLLEDSGIIKLERHGGGEGETEGTVKQAIFSMGGQEFRAMESGMAHQFTFTHGTSFMVNCETQAEIDDLWQKLSDGGEIEQCGWLKDRYGVSWQIVPTVLGEIVKDNDAEVSGRVWTALMQMKKLDIEGLKRASRP